MPIQNLYQNIYTFFHHGKLLEDLQKLIPAVDKGKT